MKMHRKSDETSLLSYYSAVNLLSFIHPSELVPKGDKTRVDYFIFSRLGVDMGEEHIIQLIYDFSVS